MIIELIDLEIKIIWQKANLNFILEFNLIYLNSISFKQVDYVHHLKFIQNYCFKLRTGFIKMELLVNSLNILNFMIFYELRINFYLIYLSLFHYR